MKIPFLKAHGAKNDFLLTWREQAPEHDAPEVARAICDRHTGAGADGWIIVSRGSSSDCDGAIQLYNSDGSAAEISGNGTRCAAAFLIHHGLAQNSVCIQTGAGPKHLKLLHRNGLCFSFEMNMGRPEFLEERFSLPLSGGARDVTNLWIGNPQCAVPVSNFDFDWRRLGAEIGGHPHFPKRTNVSFLRAVDEHTIEVRFYERGAGETMSSGTGSTGAAATAIRRGLVKSPVKVLTPAGELDLRSEDADLYLTGPAEIVAEGEFHLNNSFTQPQVRASG
jgi:diaminopimelate epimerase